MVVPEEEEVVTPIRHISVVVGLLVGEYEGGLVDGALCTWYGACKVAVHSVQ